MTASATITSENRMVHALEYGVLEPWIDGLGPYPSLAPLVDLSSTCFTWTKEMP